MKKITASQFAERCSVIINTVHKSKKPVLITKHGKPFVKLLPAGDDWLGHLEGIVKIKGDIESPVAPSDAWEVSRKK